MIPTHCDLPMIRDKRYKIMELYRCSACTALISVPKGYFDDDETRLLERECSCGCGTLFTPDRYHPSQRFASQNCRLRSWRLRQRSEQLTEEVSA